MFKLLKWLIILGILATLALPFLLLENEQRVYGSAQFDAASIDSAKALLKRNDPRRLAPGEFVTQWIDEAEITLGSNYLLSQLTDGGVAIELHPGYAYIQVTIGIPENPVGRYVNGTLVLSQSSNRLFVESLTLGKINIPGFIAEPIRRFAHEQLMSISDYNAAISSLNGLQLLEDRLLVMYQWNPALVDSIKSTGQELLVDEALRERLLAYNGQIKTVAPTLPRTVALTDLMGPIFVLAQARGGDPVEENRAALLALSFYFSGVDIARMLGINLETPEAALGKKLTLSGRYDFAQHFLTSAALTVMSSSGGFADSIGLFKELDDAGGGSGFSFTDIAADRAGVIVAEIAISDARGARFVQNFFSSNPDESDFMPYALDLPELMPNSDFKRDYGDVSDPRYVAVIEDIEARLASTRFSTQAP